MPTNDPQKKNAAAVLILFVIVIFAALIFVYGRLYEQRVYQEIIHNDR